MAGNELSFGKTKNISGVVISGENNKVINIQMDAELMQKYLKGSNENKPGLNSNIIPEDIDDIKQTLNKMADVFEKYDKSKEIQVADERITKTDLKIKKAILLKTEADQLWFDHVNKRRRELNRTEHDLTELRQGFDYLNYNRKLNESYTLLEEINKAEPTNTEVLINMAKLLMVLTPDDPTDEEKLLYKVVNLINEPKDDIEKFQLAQANLYLSVSRRPFNHGAIKSARKMFDELGRSEWVAHIDNLINEDGQNTGGNLQYNNQHNFQVAGKWHVDITDAFRSTMTMDLFPNGGFTAIQQSFGLNLSANGNWNYDFNARTIYFQGWLNGMQPFLMQITIQNFYNDGFQGIGADGFGYRFVRIG